MIDFDNIEDWVPKLTVALDKVVPKPVKQKIAEYKFEDF